MNKNSGFDAGECFPDVSKTIEMRKFADLVPDVEKVQTLSALLSWSHNIHLLDMVDVNHLWGNLNPYYVPNGTPGVCTFCPNKEAHQNPG